MRKNGWWVHSVSRKSGNRSRVGPFKLPEGAVQYVKNYRPLSDWRQIMITRIFNRKGET